MKKHWNTIKFIGEVVLLIALLVIYGLVMRGLT